MSEQTTDTIVRLLYVNWQLVLVAAPTSETGIALTNYLGAAKDPFRQGYDACKDDLIRVAKTKNPGVTDHEIRVCIDLLDNANKIPPF